MACQLPVEDEEVEEESGAVLESGEVKCRFEIVIRKYANEELAINTVFGLLTFSIKLSR